MKVRQISLNKKLLVIVSILCLGLFVFYYWYKNYYYPSTDDAYAQANVIQLAAQVSGPVAKVYVQNFQAVKKGQLLFTIDPLPFQIALAKAEANYQWIYQQVAGSQDAVQTAQALLEQRKAELSTIQKNFNRTLTLVKAEQLPKAAGEDALGQLAVAKAAVQAATSQLQQAKQQLGKIGVQNAQVKIALAELQQARLNLAFTTIFAPATGTLANFNLRAGTLVTAQNPLFALIEKDNWWIDANFKETDLARIKPGQKATVLTDMYANHTYHGIVQSISHGSGAAFALFPPENATGNWVKITQRFPVRIRLKDLDPQYPLRMGASSYVTIDTTSL